MLYNYNYRYHAYLLGALQQWGRVEHITPHLISRGTSYVLVPSPHFYYNINVECLVPLHTHHSPAPILLIYCDYLSRDIPVGMNDAIALRN